jgi:hypothetical protein
VAENDATRIAPFAELVRLSDNSIADELHEQRTRRALGD